MLVHKGGGGSKMSKIPFTWFMDASKECRLSPKVISKLGLDFLERRRRAFSAVPPPKNVRDGGTSEKNKKK